MSVGDPEGAQGAGARRGPVPLPDRLDAVLFDAGMTLIRPARAVEHIYAEHARRDHPVTPELREEIRRHFRGLFEEERRKMASGEDGFVTSDEADHALWKRLCLAVAERIPGLTPWRLPRLITARSCSGSLLSTRPT
mgnify:CR=1 FL=1